MCLEKSPTVAKEECNFSEPKNQQQHNELVKDSGLLVAVDRVGVDDDATEMGSFQGINCIWMIKAPSH